MPIPLNIEASADDSPGTGTPTCKQTKAFTLILYGSDSYKVKVILYLSLDTILIQTSFAVVVSTVGCWVTDSHGGVCTC